MNYQRHELLEQLAGQYVLGTLRGRARRRFERILAQDPVARTLVTDWENRLMSMLHQVKSETPPKHVWQAVEKRLGFAQPTRSKWLSVIAALRSAPFAAALASIVIVAIAIGIAVQRSPSRWPEIAVITQPQRGEWWHVKANKNNGQLAIEATNNVVLDDQHAYELWALSASGGAPISLGLLPTRGSKTLALTAAQVQALASANKIAVSLEPLGGSPTGAPTGPVMRVVDVKVG